MKKIREYIKKYFAAVDKWLLFFCLSISVIGILCQYSLVNSGVAATLDITERVALVQIIASALGIFAAFVISNIDYHFMTKLWKLYMPLSVFLVILTFFIGMQVDESIDDKAWLRLPFGLTFQPSELLKICFIMSFAYHLSKVYGQVNKPLNLLLLCLHGGFPILLIHFQGDDGSALVFAAIFLAMLFAAGLSWKYIIAAIPVVAAAIPIAWQYFLTEDQRTRFLAVYFTEYADPLGSDYQQRLSRISIGLGQLQGEGLFQEDYWYVPKMHNDLIFSFICQALGFVGAMLVVALLCGICFRCIYDAKIALDPLGAYICYGVFAMFFFQCIVNIGMCISVLPVIGITLPLLSAGGTSISITYLGIGLVLSVHVHKRRNLFYE
ncbi:MAG: FtsW/RodA/SpoVE family cell cycle protein [Oscillospiraceae bacterium]|nr:FtsW/RodA/SpoVE family cell cycle protein [Oscillospiraceae bacterium]MBQ2998120.1 FtsW/RodA/SpoVE family cell cycle protein [Oscillospiraceae bacterium]MBQ3561361.1 FtsW/RodA/SpoVE family cell cycle protein [Oscillospiraceae bacterium]MBQ6699481.1 FtsW/RodA/SpoVE family cell cycle protein [Oscillospiraceae bacterium]MBQ6802758.1 FtsW/RodA/SpoVE family cell cycle protein [Oscillospiraceae bacterium]